jgi:hypothetical protein
MKKALVIMGILCVVLAGYTEIHAADFGTALSVMTANIPPGADVAGMGNCWVALPGFSTNNPANVAAGEPFRFGASYSYGLIAFKRGPNLNVYISSASVALPKGVLQVNFSSANSGSAGTAMDVDAKFVYAPTIELMYGLQVAENLLRDGDKLFLGAGGSLSMSKLNFSLAGENVFISRSRGFQVKVGFLYQPVSGLNFGGMYAYSRDRNDDRELTVNDDGSQFWSSRRSTSDVHQVRLGMSWQVLPRLLLAVDYQHLNLGHVKRDQIFTGAELQIIKDVLALYGGWANSGPTASIGVYFKNGGVNVAYMNNPFNDLNRHLGRSQMVMATVFMNF